MNFHRVSRFIWIAGVLFSSVRCSSNDSLIPMDAGSPSEAGSEVGFADVGSTDAVQSVPDSPANLNVAVGKEAGEVSVSFDPPVSIGSSPITGFKVSAVPGSITVSGLGSPLTLTGLSPQTAYTFSVVAINDVGESVPTSTGLLSFYDVVETFHEPMTQPNDTIFTGTFTFDSTHHTVTNLSGSLTQSMTKGMPMTKVSLLHQLSSVPAVLSGMDGLLVTTFALTTADTFDKGGFAPGGTQYFGLSSDTPNNHNAYAMIFVNTQDPTIALTQSQIEKLAYADCTDGGMMKTTCMTGTTVAGYGRLGTMKGYPLSEVVSRR